MRSRERSRNETLLPRLKLQLFKIEVENAHCQQRCCFSAWPRMTVALGSFITISLGHIIFTMEKKSALLSVRAEGRRGNIQFDIIIKIIAPNAL